MEKTYKELLEDNINLKKQILEVVSAKSKVEIKTRTMELELQHLSEILKSSNSDVHKLFSIKNLTVKLEGDLIDISGTIDKCDDPHTSLIYVREVYIDLINLLEPDFIFDNRAYVKLTNNTSESRLLYELEPE